MFATRKRFSQSLYHKIRSEVGISVCEIGAVFLVAKLFMAPGLTTKVLATSRIVAPAWGTCSSLPAHSCSPLCSPDRRDDLLSHVRSRLTFGVGPQCS